MPKRKQAKVSGLVRKWSPLLVLGLAVLIIVIDTTLLNVSLGTIIRDLNTDIHKLQWVITAYALTLAALTITGGRLGDLYGRKKLFVIGAIIFGFGSFVASISQNVGMLLLGESIIEGIGAALMMPATSSLLVATYRGRDRAIALGLWGGMAAAGTAIGPILGGYLTSEYSWRWGFRINIVIALFLVIGSVIVHESRDREEKPTLDIVAVFLSALGLLAGVFGLIEASRYGWVVAIERFSLLGIVFPEGGISVAPVAFALSLVMLTAFVRWEQRMVRQHRTPLVSMELFKNKQFVSGASVSGLLALGQVGLIFALPVFLQGVLGLDALHTGYAMLPMSISLLIMAPLGGFLSGTIKPKHIVQGGVLLSIVGLLALRAVLAVDAETSDFILPLLVYGAGVGLGMSQLNNITLSAVSVEEVGEASGANNTIRQVGSSLGSAIVGSVLVVALSAHIQSRVNSSPYIEPARRGSFSRTLQESASAVEFGGTDIGVELISESEKDVATQIVRESTVGANKIVLLVTASTASLALLATTRLPNSRRIERNQSIAVK